MLVIDLCCFNPISLKSQALFLTFSSFVNRVIIACYMGNIETISKAILSHDKGGLRPFGYNLIQNPLKANTSRFKRSFERIYPRQKERATHYRAALGYQGSSPLGEDYHGDKVFPIDRALHLRILRFDFGKRLFPQPLLIEGEKGIILFRLFSVPIQELKRQFQILRRNGEERAIVGIPVLAFLRPADFPKVTLAGVIVTVRGEPTSDAFLAEMEQQLCHRLIGVIHHELLLDFGDNLVSNGKVAKLFRHQFRGSILPLVADIKEVIRGDEREGEVVDVVYHSVSSFLFSSGLHLASIS